MTDVMMKRLAYRRLRAPRENRTRLVDPPFHEVPRIVADNRSRSDGFCYDLQGRCLSSVAQQARRLLIAEARRWTTAYRDLDTDVIQSTTPIFLAGHQPQIFHPGVWFKNFTLDRLAKRCGAVAVNFLVDTDAIKQTTLPVPGGSPNEPRLAAVPFDEPGSLIPYEEREIASRKVFNQFGRLVEKQISPLVRNPLVRRFWPKVLMRADDTDNLGACLAQARHQLESEWGSSTLEIPESWICQTEPFAWLVAHLLAHLPRFRQIYNSVLQAYRLEHRTRSAAHPAADLTQEGQWLEAPFWIWTAEDPRRRRVFARRNAKAIVISDRQGVEVSLPLTADGDASGAVERLLELTRQGIRIRGRALITTLWARLALGDLFIHGIGGAKYDHVTDAILLRFFGVQPPEFLVVSATLHLPVPRPAVTADDLRSIDFLLRELTWHPELHADHTSVAPLDSREDPERLVKTKRDWIATGPNPQNARQRFLEIRRVNQALQPWVAHQRKRLVRERAETTAALRARAILSSREYGFCLYPEETLRDFLEELLPVT